MASKKQQNPKKSRTTVPVASRAADRKAATTPKPALAGSGAGRDRLDMVGFGVLVLVSLLILAVIAVPLRNYYQGRTEIARLNESIIAKQDEKEYLLSEIEKYESDAYIEQEARRRLGVIDEGEVAFRILDPDITSGDTMTTDEQEIEESRDWYQVLWDSVAEEPDADDSLLGEDPAGDPAAEDGSADGAGEGSGDAPAVEAPEGQQPADGTGEGENPEDPDAPVGNVVEEDQDAESPMGEMPPGEVPSG
ncbi:septum formation initiator family protein [Corynebacterium sp. L4756]|uniref:septum formation initiator family protein n=1 Tax=unclassified Corynebacterium TaxID=2624378 RepID=UPI00374D03D0